MSESRSYPYETRLNIEFLPLTIIDEKSLADDCRYKWYNQTLCQVNGSVVRLGVVQGEYRWHKHDHDDKFFYVVEGKLFIDVEGRTVELGRGRDSGCPLPPAQTRAGAIDAHGSYLGCVAAKRTLG